MLPRRSVVMVCYGSLNYKEYFNVVTFNKYADLFGIKIIDFAIWTPLCVVIIKFLANPVQWI